MDNILTKIKLPLFIFTLLTSASLHAQTPIMVSLHSEDNVASESGSTGEIILQLNQPAPSGGLTVSHAIGGNADNGVDIETLANNTFIPEGNSQASIIITPIADTLVEPVESVSLTLTPGDAYTIGSPDSAAVSIIDTPTDDRPLVGIRAVDENAHEAGAGQGMFRIFVSPSNDRDTNIFYQVSGTATPGDEYDSASDLPPGDYHPLTGFALIPAGASSVDIPVTPIDDELSEGNESVRLALLSGDGYQVNAAQQNAVVTIVDNDGALNSPGLDSSAAPDTRIRLTSPQKAKLNSSRSFRAMIVDANGNPVSGASTVWSLSENATSLGGSLINSDTQSNAQGVTQANLAMGSVPGKYQLTVSATHNDETFERTINVFVGIINHVRDRSTEGVMARALDKLCPRLIDSTPTDPRAQALRTHCQAIIAGAINGQDSAIANAMRQIAPEEMLSQQLIAGQVSSQIQRRIKARLQSIRQYRKPLSLSHLSYATSEDTLTGAAFENLLNNGGAAGSADSASKWSYFVSGNFGDGKQKANHYESGFELASQSLTTGADYQLKPDLFLGIAISYGSTELEFNDNSGEIEDNGYDLSFYGSYRFNEDLYVDAALSIGQHEYKTQRHIHYTLNNTTISHTAKSAPDSLQTTLSSKIGYQTSLNSGTNIDLHIGIEVQNAIIDGYDETGADAFNLHIDKQNIEATTYEIGGSLAHAFSQHWGVIIPQLDIRWRYDSSDASNIKGHFTADTFSTAFDLESENTDQSYLQTSAGITTLMANGLSLFLQYETLLDKSSYSERQLSFGARFATQW